MIPYPSSTHSISVVPPTLRQATGTHENQHVDLVLFGWGFLLILILVGSRQLMRTGYRNYQFHRSVVLLQRRAAFERLLVLRAPPKKAPQQDKFQQP